MKREFDGKDEKSAKRSVSFGGATKDEFEGEDESGEFNKQDINNEGKGSPRPEKKVIEVKDLSDGMNEKDRIKALLEKQEKE